MTVGIVGDGPAVEAVEAALADVDEQTERTGAGELGGVEFGVVVGQAGATVFETANGATREAGVPWLAVELGGLGGFPVVDAAVAALAPGGPCYECLSGRVGANLDPETEPVAAPAPPTARFAGAVAGREAIRHLEGVEVLGRVTEVGSPPVGREVLPLPGCVCGASPGRRPGRGGSERDLEAALASAERGVDERVGVVREVGEAESFPVPYYLAQVCDTAGFSDAGADRQAAGVDADWDRAFMKALGEAMERYCAGVYRRADLERGLPADVAGAVPPGEFVCPEEPAVTAPLDWVEGESLDRGVPVRLPAAFVFHPPPGERFRPPITTGLGLGSDGVEALLSGLYEVIERDAAMLSWYSSFDPLELTVEDEVVETLTGRARAADLSVTLLLLTQDVDIPVVGAAVQREAWPRFALGSAAHLDVTRAARSALSEALQNWTELEGMGREAAADAGGAIGEYADLPPAAERFVETEMNVPAESLESVQTAAEQAAGEGHLDAVVERVTETGLSVHATRLTTRDVAEMGFEAVRVLVPGAQPLFLDEPYFGARAERVPADLGFEPLLDRDHHPFP